MAGFDSLYFGKVIRDSDLLNEGDTRPYNRVKVLIVGQTSVENESFQQPLGSNSPSGISQQALDVVDKELYAYVLQPITGSGSGTVYNATKDLVSVSDTGDIEELAGQPPAEAYFGVKDGFIGGMGSDTAGVNATAGAYSPDNRSNAYKGTMSLPSVGANVVVSFMNGVRGMPIVLGVIPSAADVDSIHGMGLGDEMYPNYPFAYSNLKGPNEVVEGGEAGEAAAAGVGEAGAPGAGGAPVHDDYSDLPPDKQELYSQLPPADAARFAAQDRARAKSMAASRADTISSIREVRGDAAADAAARQL